MEDFEYKELGEVSIVKRGASPRPIQDPKWWGGEIGWVRISDVTSSNKYLYQTKDYLSTLGVSKSIRINKDDVILSICATIGRPIITKIDVCIHDGFVWFDSLQENIKKEYLYYFLLYKENEIASSRQTGTQGNLNTHIVSKIKIPIPPVTEQILIAEILSTVDRAIEQTEALIAKLQRIKTGLMQDLLTNGIDENGNIRSEETHSFKDSPLGRLPKEWEVASVADVAIIINGGTPRTSTLEYWNGNIPWLSVEDFNTGNRWIYGSSKYITELGLMNSSTRILKKGMLIISARGTVGVIAQLGKDMAFNQTSYGLDSSDKKKLSNDYFYYSLTYYTHIVFSLSYGNVFNTITRNTFHEIKIPIPNLAEQNKIVKLLSEFDEFIEKEKSLLKKQRELKTGLMQDLLTGKVRVTELLKKRQAEVS